MKKSKFKKLLALVLSLAMVLSTMLGTLSFSTSAEDDETVWYVKNSGWGKDSAGTGSADDPFGTLDYAIKTANTENEYPVTLKLTGTKPIFNGYDSPGWSGYDLRSTVPDNGTEAGKLTIEGDTGAESLYLGRDFINVKGGDYTYRNLKFYLGDGIIVNGNNVNEMFFGFYSNDVTAKLTFEGDISLNKSDVLPNIRSFWDPTRITEDNGCTNGYAKANLDVTLAAGNWGYLTSAMSQVKWNDEYKEIKITGDVNFTIKDGATVETVTPVYDLVDNENNTTNYLNGSAVIKLVGNPTIINLYGAKSAVSGDCTLDLSEWTGTVVPDTWDLDSFKKIIPPTNVSTKFDNGDTTSATFRDVITLETCPEVRNGYVFKWKDQYGNLYSADSEYTVYNKVEFTSYYTPESVSVTIDGTEGAYDYAQEIILPPSTVETAPTYKHFVGWSDGTDDYASGATYTVSTTATLTPVFDYYYVGGRGWSNDKVGTGSRSDAFGSVNYAINQINATGTYPTILKVIGTAYMGMDDPTWGTFNIPGTNGKLYIEGNTTESKLFIGSSLVNLGNSDIVFNDIQLMYNNNNVGGGNVTSAVFTNYSQSKTSTIEIGSGVTFNKVISQSVRGAWEAASEDDFKSNIDFTTAAGEWTSIYMADTSRSIEGDATFTIKEGATVTTVAPVLGITDNDDNDTTYLNGNSTIKIVGNPTITNLYGSYSAVTGSSVLDLTDWTGEYIPNTWDLTSFTTVLGSASYKYDDDSAIECEVGDWIELAECPEEKENYLFKWQDAAGNLYNPGDEVQVYYNMVFTSVYKPAALTVSIDGISASYDYGAVITLPTTSTQTPPEYMNLVKWSDGTTTYEAGASYTVTKAATITPVFDYEVRYVNGNWDDGSGSGDGLVALSTGFSSIRYAIEYMNKNFTQPYRLVIPKHATEDRGIGVNINCWSTGSYKRYDGYAFTQKAKFDVIIEGEHPSGNSGVTIYNDGGTNAADFYGSKVTFRNLILKQNKTGVTICSVGTRTEDRDVKIVTENNVQTESGKTMNIGAAYLNVTSANVNVELSLASARWNNIYSALSSQIITGDADIVIKDEASVTGILAPVLGVTGTGEEADSKLIGNSTIKIVGNPSIATLYGSKSVVSGTSVLDLTEWTGTEIPETWNLDSFDTVLGYSVFDYSGDLNNDGVTDIRDLVRLKKNLSNSEGTTLENYADFDGDNEVTASDLPILVKFILGKISYLDPAARAEAEKKN